MGEDQEAEMQKAFDAIDEDGGGELNMATAAAAPSEEGAGEKKMVPGIFDDSSDDEDIVGNEQEESAAVAMGVDEVVAEETVVEEPEELDIERPLFEQRIGSDLNYVKLPNFLSLEPVEDFDKNTYVFQLLFCSIM